MSAAKALRRGWCPGALRPMESGDGLLVRLRITGGILPAALARAVAACAREFGNGAIDLTARANLQLRGVSDVTLGPLGRELARLGLLDADPETESVRNVIASPLAGLDRTALLDIRPLVVALERRLVSEPRLRGVPGKFGFLVDDGGWPGLGGIDMDVRFEAAATAAGPRFCVALGGTAATAAVVGACRPAEMPEVAVALGRAFLDRRGRGPDAPRRMRDLASADRTALARAMRLDRREITAPPDRSGPILGPNRVGSFPFIGVGAPCGRLSADLLDRLATVAARFGTGEIRLTPWRAALLPGVAPERARSSAKALGAEAILDPNDPRRRVAACPGAPACRNGSTPTQYDAAALAPLAATLDPAGVAVHVSGCPKGCAHPHAAAVTLVGREGRYDLVPDGRASDPPVRLGLTLAEAKAAIADLSVRLVPG